MALRRLGILRHAKSSWSDPGKADFERPLNKRGQHDAPLMGRQLKERGVRPQRIVSSAALRARTTAELAGAAWGFTADDIVTTDALYLASAGTLLATLDDRASDIDEVIVVAHNPGMTDLCNRVSDARIDNLPTAGFFYVEADADSWSDFADGRGTLKFFIAPKLLRDDN